jgi:hypothetical protein
LKFVDPFDRLANFAAFDRHLTGRCFFDLKMKVISFSKRQQKRSYFFKLFFNN